jgi:alkane 1-monooxygenase
MPKISSIFISHNQVEVPIKPLYHEHKFCAKTFSSSTQYIIFINIQISNAWWVYMSLTSFIALLHLVGWYFMDQLYFTAIPLFTFVLVPIVDMFLPRVQATYTSESGKKDSSYYRASLYIYTMLQTFILIYSLYRSRELLDGGRYFVYIMQIFSLGVITTAPSAAVAHELIHRLNRNDQRAGKFLFAQFLYSHFPIEHVYGHHKNVATDADPASARMNESLYAFVPRSMLGTLKHTWHIENERLQIKYGLNIPLKTYLFEHRILSCIVVGDILVPAAIFMIMGKAAWITFMLQAFMSIFFTESINYLEHYGLRRKKIGSHYEPVSEQHSWDAPFTISCYLYVNLMLHADHHAHPLKPYHQLQPGPQDTPLLPYGYATLFLMALFPPLYFSVMHKLPALQANSSQS